MARKIRRIIGLPQLPKEIHDQRNPRDKFTIDQLRTLYDHKYALEQLIDINNSAGTGGHIIQDEGVDLPNQPRLNFIGAAVTATDNTATSVTDVTITTGSQNVFTNVAVAGQSDIVADSTTDTLTVAAGSGIVITTNAGTDTLTIATNVTAGMGPQGPPGPQGEDGEPGDPGPPGPPGVTTTNVQIITTPGTGVVPVPAGVTAMWVTMIGAGAGGQTGGANAGGGGGGSGELVSGMLVAVPANGTVAYTLPAGGAADTNGGSTSFGVYIALGGKTGISPGKGGTGGNSQGVVGGLGGSSSNPGTNGTIGLASSSLWFGGSGGGGSGNGAGAAGGVGGGSGGRQTGGAGGATAASKGGGGGGGSSVFASGVVGADGNAAASDAGATAYGVGGGGGGGGTKAGGAGGQGYLMLSWIGTPL